MGRFDRYMLSQLILHFGFFSLVLVLVYWVNRAVTLFDQLIANGQSALVFLEFTALTLPNVIRIVLPISGFAATVYVTNKLTSESELVVVQSTGFSPYRLARPVLFFGVFVAVLMSILTHVLVPTSNRQLNVRTAEIAENIAASFLIEGRFLHPSRGITFYIREITPQGELKDMFLSDARRRGSVTTYTSKRALIVRDASGPKLLMFDGLAQELNTETNRLSTTKFKDFVFDISALIKISDAKARTLRELPTTALFNPDDSLLAETKRNLAEFRSEIHLRSSQSLLAIVASLAGFACLLIGGFSRFGIWRQIIGAVIILVVIKTIDNVTVDMSRQDATLWPVLYLPAVLGFLMAYVLLWWSTKPQLPFRRRPA